MITIINQFRGLGDIMFIVPMLRELQIQGKKIVVPYDPVFGDIGKHFPDITFVPKPLLNLNYDIREYYHHEGYEVIPLRYSDQLCGVPFKDCMRSKYMMMNLPLDTWRKLTFRRDIEHEKKLYYILGIKEGEPYTLVNDVFTTAMNIRININPANLQGKQVKMKVVPGFTLIDWLTIIQNATYIHTVSTAIIYIFEVIELQAKEVHIYTRQPVEKNHLYYDYLLTKNYTLHD